MLLEKTLNLLKPFEAITKEMSAKCSLVSEVIPMVATLNLYLAKEREGSEFAGVGKMKETILQDLNNRFGSVTNNKNYYLATVLDPRFKLAFFNSNERKNQIKEQVISIMEMNIKCQSNSDNLIKINQFLFYY